MNQHRPVATAYDEDFYAWTQDQARRLRKLEAADSDLPVAIDFAHVAEEIEDLGKSELRGTTSLIRNIMLLLIKAVSSPHSEAVPHWLSETITLHADIPGVYTPSMRQLIDVEKLWRDACRLADSELSLHGDVIATTIPTQSPFQLSDFLAENFKPRAAVCRISAADAVAE